MWSSIWSWSSVKILKLNFDQLLVFDHLVVWLKNSYFGESTLPLSPLCLWQCLLNIFVNLHPIFQWMFNMNNPSTHPSSWQLVLSSKRGEVLCENDDNRGRGVGKWRSWFAVVKSHKIRNCFICVFLFICGRFEKAILLPVASNPHSFESHRLCQLYFYPATNCIFILTKMYFLPLTDCFSTC